MDPPPEIVKLATRMVDQALSRCAREGIEGEEFLRAFKAVEAAGNFSTISELFSRTFQRLEHMKCRRFEA